MNVEEVVTKAFKILRKELSAEEYLIYLQAITPRMGDAVKELREETKDLSLDNVVENAKDFEKKINES
jgi:hypothetical protein